MIFLLRMKFQAFVIMLIAFAGLLFLLYVKRSFDWLVGLEEEVPEIVESVDQAIAREVAQIPTGWSGPAKHGDIPVMLWWTPFTGDDGLQTCGDYRCLFTNDRSYRHHPMLRTIFFYGTDFKPYDVPLPRKPGEDWALFHEESPKNNPIFSHKEMMANFNHTSTFRKHSDFPLTTQYLESLEMVTDPAFLIPLNVKNRMVDEGLAPVAYVQSGCDTPSQRDEWVKEFMKYVKVDSYGECLNNKQLTDDIKGSEQMEHKEYLNLLAKYKFIISIENAVCEDYVTEKLWRTLKVGAVPIYLGAPNIEEYLPNKKSAVLVKNFNSVEDVANHVKLLHSDETLYKSYLSHKLAHNRDTSSLITNQLLKDMVHNRKWGVTSEQQARMGNFVAHFQCFVCERVARNLRFTNLGFKPLPYDANEDHYGCQAPGHPITQEVDMSSWWTERWFRSKYEAEVLRSLALENIPFNSSAFFSKVLKHMESSKL